MKHKVTFRDRTGKSYKELFDTKEEALWRVQELKETGLFELIEVTIVSG